MGLEERREKEEQESSFDASDWSSPTYVSSAPLLFTDLFDFVPFSEPLRSQQPSEAIKKQSPFGGVE